MIATKTNERPGTRAQVKYVRSSAYKVREVLNLIRTKSFAEATDILMFSERRISDTVQKCLNSAAANAENNDNIPSEELFKASDFTFNIISVTSSLTPLIEVNSCKTPSI